MAIYHGLNRLPHHRSDPLLRNIFALLELLQDDIVQRPTSQCVHDKVEAVASLVPLVQSNDVRVVKLLHHHDLAFHILHRHLDLRLPSGLDDALIACPLVLHQVRCTEGAHAQFLNARVGVPNLPGLLGHEHIAPEQGGAVESKPPQRGNKQLKELIEIQKPVAIEVEPLEELLSHSSARHRNAKLRRERTQRLSPLVGPQIASAVRQLCAEDTLREGLNVGLCQSLQHAPPLLPLSLDVGNRGCKGGYGVGVGLRDIACSTAPRRLQLWC
mmetsp:Transcript_51531/g.167212  ORF Transcript_51531/g.167212 Transcript_51531/m.167212 type:complete len:271 (-) Transcript_51531:240-1052(-)